MAHSDEKFRRINILIREGQHEQVQKLGLNLSGLVRDLLDDRFSHRKVVLSVSPETRALYDRVISNFGATDAELERYFVSALDMLLQEKAKGIEAVRKELRQPRTN